MPSERAGNNIIGVGQVFLGETKIADVNFDLIVRQEYQNINGVKFLTGVREVEGTIRSHTGVLPPNVELTLNYLGRWRLKFRTANNSGAIAANGGPYEEEGPSPP